MAKQTVADEPGGKPEQGEPDWIEGFASSSLESANSPLYPGNQVWEGVGARAVAWKAHWKDKPGILPWGSNDEGGK